MILSQALGLGSFEPRNYLKDYQTEFLSILSKSELLGFLTGLSVLNLDHTTEKL